MQFAVKFYLFTNNDDLFVIKSNSDGQQRCKQVQDFSNIYTKFYSLAVSDLPQGYNKGKNAYQVIVLHN